MSYVDGFVLPIPENAIEKYRAIADAAGRIWMEHGALMYKECVGDDLSPASAADTPQELLPQTFPSMLKPKEGETVVFAFILYKSREHRDEVNQKVMADPRMMEMCPSVNPDLEMPFDVQRMAWGGFKAIVDF